MRGAPGSLWWLFQHESRLSWRGIGGKSLWVTGISLLVLWGFLHFASYQGLRALKGGELPPFVLALAGIAFWFLASIVLSQAIAHAVIALFDRGDLDLLLSSPLPPRHVLAMRGLNIAASAVLMPAVLLLPFAHLGPFLGQAGMLGIYPTLAAVGLASAAVGIGATMSLVRLVGARRAKTLAQIFAALMGAGIFLTTQLQNFLPPSSRRAILEWGRRELQPGGWLAPETPWWWPVRAMTGEALPLLAVTALGAGLFFWVVRATQRRFAAGAIENTVGGATRTRLAISGGPTKFRTGQTRLMLMKEWRMIFRDPTIISQTLLQLLYMIPLIFLGLRSEKNLWMLIPGFVLMASMLAGNLAWLTMAAEDAPELVGIAPIPRTRLLWMKAVAAGLPVMLLVLPVALWWLPRDGWSAILLIACATGGIATACLCHLLNPRQGDRKDMRKRYQQNKLVNLLEAFGAMGWAGLAVCIKAYPAWTPAAIAVIALGPAAAWLLGRRKRD